jgi:hypothetical protein
VTDYYRIENQPELTVINLNGLTAPNELSNDSIRMQLADVVLGFEGDERGAAEIAEPALSKLG